MKQSLYFRSHTPQRAILAIAGVLVAASPALYAQVDTGSVAGTVTDSSGAVVSGAQITERNLGSNATRTARSSTSGAYTFDGLPAAQYEITITAPGFEVYVQQVEITVGGHPPLDAKLTVGQGTEKVKVTAAFFFYDL